MSSWGFRQGGGRRRFGAATRPRARRERNVIHALPAPSHPPNPPPKAHLALAGAQPPRQLGAQGVVWSYHAPPPPLSDQSSRAGISVRHTSCSRCSGRASRMRIGQGVPRLQTRRRAFGASTPHQGALWHVVCRCTAPGGAMLAAPAPHCPSPTGVPPRAGGGRGVALHAFRACQRHGGGWGRARSRRLAAIGAGGAGDAGGTTVPAAPDTLPVGFAAASNGALERQDYRHALQGVRASAGGVGAVAAATAARSCARLHPRVATVQAVCAVHAPGVALRGGAPGAHVCGDAAWGGDCQQGQALPAARGCALGTACRASAPSLVALPSPTPSPPALPQPPQTSCCCTAWACAWSSCAARPSRLTHTCGRGGASPPWSARTA